MEPIKVMIITGTRPEIIKISILLRLIKKSNKFQLIYVHSGQHYDDNVFSIFLKTLELPSPNYNINVGSAPNCVQTGKMLIELDKIINNENPNIILAQGDTNTVLATALSAFKNQIVFGHIEAGIRSYDMRMPEEINRILTGACTLLHFAPTPRAVLNLLNEGVFPERIFLVGNTIVDVVHANLNIALKKSNIEKKLNLKKNRKFILLTAHRPSNVDNKECFSNIINALISLPEIKIIYPIHPRSLKNLKKFGLKEKIKNKNIQLIEPLGYIDFLKLMNLSYFIITDSGGLQEESLMLKKPCLTLRDNTERPESIEAGTNILVGNDKNRIIKYMKLLLEDEEFYKSMKCSQNPFGDGMSSEKILKIIENYFKKNDRSYPHFDFKDKIPTIELFSMNDDEEERKLGDFELKNKCKILEIYNKDGKMLIPKNSFIIKRGMSLKCFYY